MKAEQVIVCQLGKHQFGVDIKSVLEILNLEPITPVPESPDYVDGVINVRGNVCPIIYLRRRLNMPLEAKQTHNKIILVHVQNSNVGLLVDDIKGILDVKEESVEQVVPLEDETQINCVQYLIKQLEEKIIVLDLDKIVFEQNRLFVQGVTDEDDSSSNAE